MRKIRVLVVDDSIVVRRLVTDVLAADPSIEIAGTAPTGRIALARIPQVQPDVVTLDVEMPELDGLMTLREIRKSYPRLAVIMFSTVTERGAAATIDALSHGANDYVTKPANVGSVAAGMQQVRDQLIPKIKALCPETARGGAAPVLVAPVAAPGSAAGARAPAAPPKIARAAPPDQRVDVLAIATSTGGPNALSAILPALPGDLPVPVVIVQHMPPMFTRLLAEHLAKKCALTVSEAAAGDLIRPGHICIAPGDFHLVVARSGDAVRAQLQQGPPENSCRPAADVLFRSVAEVYGPHALGVVLTGMGQDGLRGSEMMRQRGGRILAQDEPSSVVWGMAGAVARAGIVDGVWPLSEIAQVIIRRVQHLRPNWRPKPAPASALVSGE